MLPGKSSRRMPWTSVDSLPTLLRNECETKTALIWSRPWDDLAEKDSMETVLIAHVASVLATVSTLRKKTNNYWLYEVDTSKVFSQRH